MEYQKQSLDFLNSVKSIQIQQDILKGLGKMGLRMEYFQFEKDSKMISYMQKNLIGKQILRWGLQDKRSLGWIMVKYMLQKNKCINRWNCQLNSEFMSLEDFKEIGKIIEQDYQQVIRVWLTLYEVKKELRGRKKWSKIEEENLQKIYQKYQQQLELGEDQNEKQNEVWNQIAIEYNWSYLKEDYFVSLKQIREHWNNSLNPQIKKSEFSLEEDQKLMVSVLEFGKQWKKITRQVFQEKRQQNQIKNRYYQVLKKSISIKKLRTMTLNQERQLVEEVLKNIQNGKIDKNTDNIQENYTTTQEESSQLQSLSKQILIDNPKQLQINQEFDLKSEYEDQEYEQSYNKNNENFFKDLESQKENNLIQDEKSNCNQIENTNEEDEEDIFFDQNQKIISELESQFRIENQFEWEEQNFQQINQPYSSSNYQSYINQISDKILEGLQDF